MEWTEGVLARMEGMSVCVCKSASGGEVDSYRLREWVEGRL